jgi:hypothetical protein
MGFADLLLRKHSVLASAVFTTSLATGFVYTALTGQHVSTLVTGDHAGESHNCAKQSLARFQLSDAPHLSLLCTYPTQARDRRRLSHGCVLQAAA